MSKWQASHFPTIPFHEIKVQISESAESSNASMLQILFLQLEDSGLLCDRNHNF